MRPSFGWNSGLVFLRKQSKAASTLAVIVEQQLQRPWSNKYRGSNTAASIIVESHCLTVHVESSLSMTLSTSLFNLCSTYVQPLLSTFAYLFLRALGHKSRLILRLSRVLHTGRWYASGAQVLTGNQVNANLAVTRNVVTILVVTKSKNAE